MKKPDRAERERRMRERLIEALPDTAEIFAHLDADKAAGISIDAPIWLILASHLKELKG
jgi:hypothetical protein